MTEPWHIDWYVCTADTDDVKYAKSKGRTIKVGDELWRVPRSIGPISTNHCHWAGQHLDVSEDEAYLAAAAPVLQEAVHRAKGFIKAFRDNDLDDHVADGGVTVEDALRDQAQSLLELLERALKISRGDP